ncbi:MAG: hypothetical protein IPK14_26520 [Blastocatellia bacterium]|nr:hypothetical protein [Blastocatellia bacterium]
MSSKIDEIRSLPVLVIGFKEKFLDFSSNKFRPLLVPTHKFSSLSW